MTGCTVMTETPICGTIFLDEAHISLFVQPTIGTEAKHQKRAASVPTFKELEKLVLTEVELAEHGYPSMRPDGPGAAIPLKSSGTSQWVPANDLRRTCCRCFKAFSLDISGNVPNISCVYHYRKKFDRSLNQKVFKCCDGKQKKGCRIAKTHVFNVTSEETLCDFVSTPPSNGCLDFRSKKVYSLDTEMVFTTNGMEIGRVTMLDISKRVVMDNYVLPEFPILDCNTEFSGITEKDLKSGAMSLEKCRSEIFQFVNAETVLIGHSLESDLKALRLTHERVIDTAVLFAETDPRSSKKIKISLKNLAEQHLGTTIQAGENGHCPKEDAETCIDLVKMFLNRRRDSE